MKKQTIWLLTMLSLVVVLSVYYVTTPDKMKTASFMNLPSNQDTDTLDSTPKDTNKTSKSDSEKETAANEETTSEVFLKQRMEQEDLRAQLIEEYQTTVDSATATAEERSKAYTDMTKLQNLMSLESDVETMIKEAGYKEVLVRSNDSEVNIAVKSTKHSKKEANDIIQMTRSVLGEKLVVVNFMTK